MVQLYLLQVMKIKNLVFLFNNTFHGFNGSPKMILCGFWGEGVLFLFIIAFIKLSVSLFG